MGTYEQIVTHLEREVKVTGLEALDELQINNVSQQPTNTQADRPKRTCHHCKKPGHYRNQCRCSENEQKKNQKTLETKTVTLRTLTRTTTSVLTTTKSVTEPRKNRKLFTHPRRQVKKHTIPLRKVTLEPMQPIDHLPGTEDRKDEISSRKKQIRATLMNILKLQPKI